MEEEIFFGDINENQQHKWLVFSVPDAGTKPT